jgi:hypothetical protein
MLDILGRWGLAVKRESACGCLTVLGESLSKSLDMKDVKVMKAGIAGGVLAFAASRRAGRRERPTERW